MNKFVTEKGEFYLCNILCFGGSMQVLSIFFYSILFSSITIERISRNIYKYIPLRAVF